MISADFYRNKDNKLLGFSITGHADYDVFGEDVCCASVSSAAMLTANTITDAFYLKAKVSAENNDFMLKLGEDNNGTGDKIILGLLTHLYLMSEEFPGRIKVSVHKK